MSLKKTVLTILTIVIFVYPSMNQSVQAEEIKYTGRSNHAITLQDAASLTKLFRVNVESNAMLVSYFGKEAVEKALAQPGSVNVHAYYGKNQDGKPGFFIFGVDKKGKEMIASFIPNCGVRNNCLQ